MASSIEFAKLFPENEPACVRNGCTGAIEVRWGCVRFRGLDDLGTAEWLGHRRSRNP